MTTARARAVTRMFGGKLRQAFLAGASGALVLSLAPSAGAASCTTTATNDTCIIKLGDLNSLQDGQGGTDRLQFDDNANVLNVTAAQFKSGTGNFLSFEEAEVVGGTTLNITSVSGDAPVSMSWFVDAGAILNISGAGGNAIGNTSAMTVNGVFNVNESETIGSLAGAGSVVIALNEALSTGGAGTATPFSGIISGGGGFTKIDANTLVLSGNNSYTGATTVSGGILEIANAGAIDNSSAVNISVGAQLTGTTAYIINAPVINDGRLAGNVTVNGNVTSSGGLLPGNTAPGAGGVSNPGQAMGIITINGNYTASGGAFVGMFVDLDAAVPANGTPGTTHDFVNIVGNVSGTSKLFLAEFDDGIDVGGATTGNGIQVFRVTGTTTAGAFVQGNALSAGAYQYLLRYVANYAGTDDGYFLQSAIRDEMIAHPALLSAGQALLRHCFRDDQRVPDSPKGATYGRAWFGYRQGNSSFGADTGIDMDQDFNCTTGGMDYRMGQGWFGGVSGGFGKSEADLVTPAGIGNLDGSARVIEAYASFTSSSLFLNLSAGYSEIDWDYRGALLGQSTTSVTGLIASAQAGVALALEPFAVKIFGAVNYDGMECGEDCFGFAAVEDTGLIEAKGTVRFDGVGWGGAVRPWAAVSYSDVLSDGVNTVSLGAVSVSADTNAELLSIDAGLQAYLDENFALYADGGYHESLSKDITGYKAGIGLKLYW